MASLRQRADTGQLFFDFRWDGKRFRAQTYLNDTPTNRASLEPQLKRLNTALKTKTFHLETFFPELSNKPAEVATVPPAAPTPIAAAAAAASAPPTPLFLSLIHI